MKLLTHDAEQKHPIGSAASLSSAVRVIVIADLIMSLDNILAIAGVSDGSSFLVLFGLGLSIPIVIAGAAFVAALMNHCGWIIYLGAAILGEVAGKMIVEDDFVELTVGCRFRTDRVADPNYFGGRRSGQWPLFRVPLGQHQVG